MGQLHGRPLLTPVVTIFEDVCFHPFFLFREQVPHISHGDAWTTYQYSTTVFLLKMHDTRKALRHGFLRCLCRLLDLCE